MYHLIVRMYNGQYKQDELLDKQVFKGLEHGVFVDVGAHDGVSISNTFFFEQHRRWTGICIEPNPNVYPNLQKSRTCITLPYAVDCSEGVVDFICNDGYTEMLSGLATYYDVRHHQRKQKEIQKHGGSSTIIQVPTKRLDTILAEKDVTHINYLSIDVEGGELAVLKSIDFDAVFIDVIGFECNYPDSLTPIVTFLREKGFKMLYSNPAHADVFMIHERSEFTSCL